MEGEQLVENKEKKHRKRMKAIHSRIREQMEFYFGDANLYKDRFLKQQIDKSQDGYIDISIFLTFNRIKAITEETSVIAKALSKSDLIEVNEDSTKLRRKKPLEPPKNVDERTVYVECLPNSIDHDWLKRLFSACGKVSYVSLPRYKSTRDPKGFAFVEFETEEGAQKACQELNNPPVDASDRPGRFPVKGSKTLVQLRKKVKGPEEERTQEQEMNVPAGGKENTDIDGSSALPKKRRKRRRQTSESSLDGSSEVSPVKQKKFESQDSREEEITVKTEPTEESTVKTEPIKEITVKTEPTEGGKSDDEDKADKKKKKRKRNRRRTDSSQSVTDSENPDLSVKEEEIDSKRQKVETDNSVKVEESSLYQSQQEKHNPEERDPSSTPQNQESEKQNGSNKKTNKKKKRKRKKHHKPEKDFPELRVISKKEWLQLRNEYLALQKASMANLKKSLVQLKQEPSEEAKGGFEETKQKGREIKFVPGVILKIEGRNAMTRKQVKDDLVGSGEIVYIDIQEECMVGYIRCKDADSAQKIISLQTQLYTFSLLTGDEEKAYWDKLAADRETKLNSKQKSKKRGTQKLIEQAQKTNRANVERKHIVFDD